MARPTRAIRAAGARPASPPWRPRRRSMRMAAANPPQVGNPITKDSLNAKLGALANNERKVKTGYEELIDILAPYSAADLLSLGFTQEEADLYLSCVRGPTEAPAVVTTYDGHQFLNRVGGV